MNKKKYSGFIIVGILVIMGIFLIVTYNGLVKKDEKVKLQWNEVQNAYQRRMDLIPNIVNVVKGQADFEQTTLQKVTEARAKAVAVSSSANDIAADKFKQLTAAQDELAATTNRLMVTIEKYPSLKGTEAFAGLQAQLEGTERRIKFARKDFNSAIADFNSDVRSFPTSLVAGLLGFKSKEGFQSDEGADRSIEIKFN